MPFSRLAILLLGLGALVLPGCQPEGRAAAPAKTVDDRFPIRVGDKVVHMQVAALPAELERGLMQRTNMGADEGMLFVFPVAQRMGFWMRNTLIPLDIGYFDAKGELREVYPMYPRDERSVYSRSQAIQICLEMNQGWFKSAGVRPGAKLDLAAVAAALRERGMRPEAFGLK